MNSAPEVQRLFFALWPDEVTREALRRATRKAVHRSGGRPVDPANLHLTLAFLGGVGPERVGPVLAAAEGVSAGPFKVTLDQVGFWPKPRILWFGATNTPDTLRDLVNHLGAALRPQGFVPDPRPYRPHITLARKVSRPGRLKADGAVLWPVSEFVLARSDTLREGARYEVLQRWAL